jgi:C4-dicarboxylate-specific signal transduction histidine kinase
MQFRTQSKEQSHAGNRIRRVWKPIATASRRTAGAQADANTAVVCIEAASVNPSDVKNVAGRMPQTTLPRVTGRDYSGVEALDLNEATREVIALSLNRLHMNRVSLREELADDLPVVIGNRVQLQQVILDLVLNASDAMSAVDDRPRQLMIRTERDEAIVCV